MYFDPDRAADAEQADLARRGVWLHHGERPGTTEVSMTLDTLDAAHFDNTLADVAAQLGRLGDLDPVDVRRAKAVGVLTDPQQALDLLTGHDTGPTRRPTAIVHLHIGAADLNPSTSATSGSGAGHVEKLGAATPQLLRDWVGRSDVSVGPVLDLGRTDAVEAHDPPGWMRELVLQRDPSCVFPGCARDSRACDLDHITAYISPDEGGPPGQTHPANLAPLCRTHHRAKTHGHWSYKRRDDGSYWWLSPQGRAFTVTTTSRRPAPPR